MKTYSTIEKAWIGLSICTTFNSLPLTHLVINSCGVEKAFEIYKHTGHEIGKIPEKVKNKIFSQGYSPNFISKSLEYSKEILELKSVEKIISNANKLGVKIITPENDLWPMQLECLDNQKPLVLWCKGDEKLLLETKMFSIVGSRKCSPYGKNIAIDFSYDLSEKGFIIVSGGALGIDSYAHIGAINSSGKTISVLAGGVDVLYPSSNSSLFHSILEKGLIISENPIGTRPAKWKFLERNRIIAALSQMTLIVEAPEKSGALNTGNHAIECGKTLGVIPGNINSIFSTGTNKLLKEGAYPITNTNDIYELVGNYHVENQLFEIENSENTLAQQRILSSMYKTKTRTVEDLFLECELDIKQLLKTLSFLETKGKILQEENGWVLA